MKIHLQNDTSSFAGFGTQARSIVSLVPSQTELLADLGLDSIVTGITRFCVHPGDWRKKKTIVGGTKNLHAEKILKLKPDLIIANKEENRQEDIYSLAEDIPVYVSDVRNLEQALNMIRDIGILTGTGSEATAIIEKIRWRFAGGKNQTRSRCVYLIWNDPLMTVNADTFISDMLDRWGFDNVFAEKKERYPVITAEEIAAAKPDILLLSSEPYPFRQKDRTRLKETLKDLDIQFADGKAFSWYGSRLAHFDARASISDEPFSM